MTANTKPAGDHSRGGISEFRGQCIQLSFFIELHLCRRADDFDLDGQSRFGREVHKRIEAEFVDPPTEQIVEAGL
jgi:hypothetical protein